MRWSDDNGNVAQVFTNLYLAYGNDYLLEAKVTDEITALKGEIAGLKTRLQNVEYERDELYNYIVDILELARTGLPPSGMTEEQWASHRLISIARLASRAQEVAK